MKNFLISLKKGIFPSIIAFAALSVSASAAFYSVSGLSKLFAGASFEVIIMASSLEIAKLVIASLLYQYWDTINKLLRTYLTIAAIVLVLITSMGIYGFLSAAYQDTYRQLSVKENQTAFLTQKKDFYEKDVTRYDNELERISNNIATLSNAKSTAIQIKDESVVGGVRTTISTAELRLAQQRIGVEEENRKNIQAKREVAADSLQKYQLQILELENNLDVAGELGPLQYLSGLTNAPMDKIINILLLVIIFVFDPLAISLVVAANMAFDKAFPKRKTTLFAASDYMDQETIDKLYSEDEGWDEDHALDQVLNTMVKDIEVIEPKIIYPEKQEFNDLLDKIENNIILDEIEEKISNNTREIDELDRATGQIIDTIKSIDDYLKHHGPYYSSPGTNWDVVKKETIEEEDIVKPKLRSKPKGEIDSDTKIY